jgi:hypothetical protein
VPFRVVARFTLLQLVYLLGVWALTTWAGIAGIAFPLPIMVLVPLRQYVLPLLFSRQHLAELDAASYEEAPPIHDRLQAAQVWRNRCCCCCMLVCFPPVYNHLCINVWWCDNVGLCALLIS